VSEALRKGIDVTLIQECCDHYHFQIVDSNSAPVVQNDRLLEFVETTPLTQDEHGAYFIRVDKSNDVDVKPHFKPNRTYRVVIYARSDGETLSYLFFSLFKDAAKVRDESVFITKKAVDEEEDEYDEGSDEVEEEVVKEEEEEEEEEIIPVPKRRWRKDSEDEEDDDEDDEDDDDDDDDDDDEEEILPVSKRSKK